MRLLQSQKRAIHINKTVLLLRAIRPNLCAVPFSNLLVNAASWVCCPARLHQVSSWPVPGLSWPRLHQAGSTVRCLFLYSLRRILGRSD